MPLVILIALLFSGQPLQTESNVSDLDKKYLSQVTTLDQTVKTLYSVISGEKGEARNWELFHYLFQDGARLIPTGMSKSGVYKLKYTTPESYEKNSGKWLVEHGFFEQEIHRKVQQFGNIAHVFSTYECFHAKTDKEPFMRGINSIQLIHDGTRWWVVNIYWAQESEQNPIPRKFR